MKDMSRKKIDGFKNLNYKGFDHAYQMDKQADFEVSSQVTSIQVPTRWFYALQTITSTIIRSSLSESDTEKLNRLVATLNGGKTGPSPRCHTEMVGFDQTPTFLMLSDDSMRTVKTATMIFKGIKIMVLLPPTEREFIEPNLRVEDKFYSGMNMLDNIRLTFANSALRKLDICAPDIVREFGQGSLLCLLSFQKDELKAIASIFGQMISHDFSESSIIRDFWFLIMKWLVFSRFTESFVSLVTNMVQIPGNGNLIISDTGLEALKTLLQPITPIPSGESRDFKFSSDSQNKVFVENMRIYLMDLRMLASAFSSHVPSSTKFDGHINAIERSLSAIETRMPPKKFAKNMKLFSTPDLTGVLGSSKSKADITTMVNRMLSHDPRYSNVRDFFQRGPGTNFVDQILEIRISNLKKAKDMMDAQNKLTKAHIKNQKLQQELLLQTAKTHQLASHSGGNIPFDIRSSLISVSGSVDLRNDLVSDQKSADLRGGVDSRQALKRPPEQQSSSARNVRQCHRPRDLRDDL